MSMVILDPTDELRLIEQRQACGGDRYDEVWDGVYIMSPIANIEHQQIATNLSICFGMIISFKGLGVVLAGTNVSDRADDWEKNYRVPDVVVYLNGNPAQKRGAYWLGGPDFAVEVVSRYDRSRKKFDFYAKINTREVLIVDRYPWALELYRLNDAGTFDRVGRSTLEKPDILASQVLPFTFQLEPGEDRPSIKVSHTEGDQTWSA